mgnify:FL=1
MKIIPNVHDYLMEQTFNIRGNLAKDGRFDNNNIVSGRNLGLDFEVHFKRSNNSEDFNYINEVYVAENSEEEKMLRKFTRITNFIQDGSLYDNAMIVKLRHIAQKMNKLKIIAR